MTQAVIAVHRLRVSDPLAETEFTGRYADDGSPIVRKAGRTIMPGETYTPPTATELDYLLGCGAARFPDADELDNLESVAATITAPDGLPARLSRDTMAPGSLA